MKSFSRSFFSVAVAAATLSGCGGDVSTAVPDTIAGAYTTTEFTTTSGGQTTDQKAVGSFINVSLNENGTTSGQMHVAASGGAPASDDNMAGRWTATGTQLRFTQSADTFMNDMTFTISRAATGTTLSGDHTVGGTRIQLTLVKPRR